MPTAISIMIVDDDADGRFLAEHRLKRTFPDCSFIACSSGDEAMALLRCGRAVDAIVTDHQLGSTSGSEFIGQARRRGVACPIIMVTAGDDPKVERDAYEAGATRVFKGGRGGYANFLKQILHPETVESPASSHR